MGEIGIITVMGIRGFMWFINASTYNIESGECNKSTFVGIPFLDKSFVLNKADKIKLEKYTDVANVVEVAIGTITEKERSIVSINGSDLKNPNPLTRMSMLPGGLSLFIQTAFPAKRWNIVNDMIRQYSAEAGKIVTRVAAESKKRNGNGNANLKTPPTLGDKSVN